MFVVLYLLELIVNGLRLGLGFLIDLCYVINSGYVAGGRGAEADYGKYYDVTRDSTTSTP